MQRDMDLIRELLLRLEALEIRAGTVWFLELNKPPLMQDGTIWIKSLTTCGSSPTPDSLA